MKIKVAHYRKTISRDLPTHGKIVSDMQTMIENLINGNLSDAKRQARRYQLSKIYGYLINQGWSHSRATRAAHYLKTGEGFQAYCDAK